jgi:sterol desaturase/sphingolipid hydroxylase (fatty acid hydroxylase superfamily)
MVFPARPHPSRVRLFQNRWMEITTLTPLSVFVLTWMVVLAVVAVVAARHVAPVPLVICAVVGLALWTLFEYAGHRFLFHLDLKSAWGQRLIFLMHENHHADPADPLRSIMPLTVSLPLGAAIWGLALLICGSLGHAVFLGFGLGYVFYDTLHWACHQMPMRGALGTKLKRHHLRHHHAGQDANYAITAIFLDRLFGTGLKRR